MREIGKKQFDEKAAVIKQAHWAQTLQHTLDLNRKYASPVFGVVEPWKLIEDLGRCIDPTDRELYGVSQHVHILQVLNAMEEAGIKDELFLLVGLVHDLGKILLLTDESPENIVCDNGIIGDYPAGIGLDRCTQHWNHDEFAHQKLKDHLSYEMGWLVRYHSLKMTDDVKKLMNKKDREIANNYYLRFKDYDKLTKSIYHIPRVDMDKYRRLLEKHLPKTIEV